MPTCREEKPCVGEGSATRKTQTPNKSNFHSTPSSHPPYQYTLPQTLPIILHLHIAANAPTSNLTFPPTRPRLQTLGREQTTAKSRGRTPKSRGHRESKRFTLSASEAASPRRDMVAGDSDKVREMAVASPAGDDYMIRSSVGKRLPSSPSPSCVLCCA